MSLNNIAPFALLGIYSCILAQSQFELGFTRGGCDYLNWEGANFYRQSLEKCKNLCGSNSWCKAVNYFRQYQKCSLLWTINGPGVSTSTRSCLHLLKNATGDVNAPGCVNEAECKKGNGCPPYGSLSNAVVLGNMQFVGAHRLIKCNKNFPEIKGNDRIECLGTGNWSHYPKCIDVNCDEPDTHDDAILSTGSRTNGSSRTYTCKEGFGVNGSRSERSYTVSCFHGSWSSVSSICSGMNCEEPQVANAIISVGDSYHGSSREYTCEVGFGIDGSPVNNTGVAVCNMGDWYLEGCQEVYCDEPDAHDGAILSDGRNKHESSRTYTCKDGFGVNGSRSERSYTISCFHGSWSPVSSICSGMNCEEPQLANANFAIGDSFHGSTREYTCEVGFSIDGSPVNDTGVAVCNMGFWNLETCQEVYCDEPDTHDGAILSDGSNKHESARTYTCKEGFGVNGSRSERSYTISCFHGSWSPVSSICSGMNCEDPKLANANVLAGYSFHGSTREYTCEMGYSVDGYLVNNTGVTVCTMGDWNHEACKEVTPTIGEHCLDSNDCVETESVCIEHKCFCRPLFRYDKSSMKDCVKVCTDMTDDFTEYFRTYIEMYNYMTVEHVDDDDICRKGCLHDPNCMSFDVNQWKRECYFSYLTVEMISDADLNALKPRAGMKLYSRICV